MDSAQLNGPRGHFAGSPYGPVTTKKEGDPFGSPSLGEVRYFEVASFFLNATFASAATFAGMIHEVFFASTGRGLFLRRYARSTFASTPISAASALGVYVFVAAAMMFLPLGVVARGVRLIGMYACYHESPPCALMGGMFTNYLHSALSPRQTTLWRARALSQMTTTPCRRVKEESTSVVFARERSEKTAPFSTTIRPRMRFSNSTLVLA